MCKWVPWSRVPDDFRHSSRRLTSLSGIREVRKVTGGSLSSDVDVLPVPSWELVSVHPGYFIRPPVSPFESTWEVHESRIRDCLSYPN